MDIEGGVTNTSRVGITKRTLGAIMYVLIGKNSQAWDCSHERPPTMDLCSNFERTDNTPKWTRSQHTKTHVSLLVYTHAGGPIQNGMHF